jgi:hypothetical protein
MTERENFILLNLKSHPEDGEALTHNEVRKCAAFLHWTAVRQLDCESAGNSNNS